MIQSHPSSPKPRQHLWVVLTALLACGCTGPANLGGVAVQGDAIRARELINQPVEPLGGRAFTAVTAQNAQYTGGMTTAFPGAATPNSAAAPVAVGAPATGNANASPVYGSGAGSTTGMVSGNMQSAYGYSGGPFYSGSGAPTTLVSITQTEAPGAKGPYMQMLSAVVAPILKDWSADALLTRSSATTGNDGLLRDVAPPPVASTGACAPYYSPGVDSGWRLTYFSSTRAETLNFIVSANKTVIIRMRWAPLDLAAVPIAVNNDVAIKSLITAIKTPGFQSEEQKSGMDYFLGVAFNNACFNGYAVPAPAGGASQIEVIYDVPADANWNTSLQVVLGKPVWQLNYYANNGFQTMPMAALPGFVNTTTAAGADPSAVASTASSSSATTGSGSTAPSANSSYYFQNSASGEVDARTGAVIRFSRPSKQYYQQPVYAPGSPAKPPVTLTPTPTP
jgi:hypothetical protein